MLRLGEDMVGDNDVISVLGAIQQAYVAYTSNPFVTVQPGELPGSDEVDHDVPPNLPLETDRDSRAITSKLFDERILTIAGWAQH